MMIKLNAGSNSELIEGWVNMDILEIPGVVKYDARTPLPYDDNSVDFIFSEHFIEHLTETEADFYFKECYRTLRPGGVIRTTTFDIDEIIRGLYPDTWDSFKNKYLDGLFRDRDRIDIFNLIVYEGNLHKHMYNDRELIKFLARSGFDKFNKPARNKSAYCELQNLECRSNSTCIVEAVK